MNHPIKDVEGHPVLRQETEEQGRKSRRALVLLTNRPHDNQVAFYLDFESRGYDVFVVVDDNEYNASSLGAKVIQVDDATCGSRGFKNFCSSEKPGRWDKAIYYFTCVDRSHDQLWFIQDDVFLTSHEALIGVDAVCPDADIVSTDNEVNLSGSRDNRRWYWWSQVPSAWPAPWAKSPMWATRLSRSVLDAARDLIEASVNDGVPFIEFVFHTLAWHKGLKVVSPSELECVVWGRKWLPEDMNRDGFYYPVPYIEAHAELRQLLKAMAPRPWVHVLLNT